MEQLTVDTAAAPAEAARPRPIPETGAKALILFNPRAGGVTGADRNKLVALATASGVSEYKFVTADRMSKRLFENARDFDVVIVLGGDGTARAAAELARRDGPPLVLLPGGTLNILPHALYGERDWAEALEAALNRGVIKRLASGRANGAPFYVAALFGAPTILARAREAVREGRLLVAVRRFRIFIKRAFSRKIRARPDQQTPRKAAAYGVLCPAFSGGVEGESLEWVRLDANHLLDLARVSLRSLTQSWRDDPAVEIGQCRSGDIVSPGLIPATLDGEPRTFLSRIRVEYDAQGPRVIALQPEGR
ncbi:MAG: diacylglycerol kinase family protein [Hyphomonadaceae bacterium]